MRRLGLRGRLLLWGGLFFVMTVGAGAFGVAMFGRVSRVVGEALRVDREEARLERALEAALDDEDDAVLSAIAGEGDRARDASAQAERAFASALASLRSEAGDAAETEILEAIAVSEARYREGADRLLREGDRADARAIYRAELAPMLRAAELASGRLRERRFREMQAVATAAGDGAERATILFGAVSLGALLLSALVGLRLAKTLFEPLRQLTASVEAVGQNDLDQRVEARADDEVGTLARGFNRMTERLANIDARRVAEIVRAHSILEATVEALPEAVLVVEPSGDIVLTNARARSLFASGVPSRVEHVPLPPHSLAALCEALAGESPKSASRSDLARAMRLRVGAETRLYLPRIVRVESPSQSVVVVLDDVTELARFDEMRTEFIAVAAHELRTPLTTLQMTLALLEETPERGERERETLAIARVGCEQLATTVHEFLDSVSLESKETRLAREPVVVATLVESVRRALSARFHEHEIELVIEPEGASLRVLGDRLRLVTALSNLLTNALKYSPRGGVVRLACGDDGAFVRVVVDDRGPGVPRDMRERIFEKYFRVEHVRAHGLDVVRGAGLGLYLCRQIVEAHGGDLACEEAPGGGARLVARLPRALNGETATTVRAGSCVPGSSRSSDTSRA